METTPGAQLRRIYLPSPSIKVDTSIDNYMSLLKQKGLYINPSLYPSMFQTKNGLPYPGIAATSQIISENVLVKVPQSMVLTPLKALQEKELQQVFKHDFYHHENSWEDRVLITYCLYLLYKKDENNIWYHMVIHMSKQIDILGFWSNKDIQLFLDPTIKSVAQLDLDSFQHEWQQFQACTKQLKLLQNKQYFNKDNYKWIYTHMVSRCFGKTLRYTSMVPFCEFFNHHNSDVIYKTDTQEEKQYVQNDDNTSYGSNQSEDYLDTDQFDYESIQSQNYTWSYKECLDLNEKQTKNIQSLYQSITTKIYDQIDWKDFSILFVGFIIERTRIIRTEYLAGRKQYDRAFKQLKSTKQSVEKYMKQLAHHYESIKKKHIKNFSYKYVKEEQKQAQKKQQEKKLFKHPTDTQDWQNFILTTGKKDYFQANNQVYFCYGRLSNRLLLSRYGIAIEGNKYDHVWINFDIGSTVGQFPDVVKQMMNRGLSKKRKFKIRPCTFNEDIIIFFRLNSWVYYRDQIQDIYSAIDKERQIAILQQVKQNYLQKLQLLKGDFNLQDKKISYHEYFIRVYQVGQQKILMKQIDLISKLIQILSEMITGAQLEKATQKLSELQRKMLQNYLKKLK